MTTPRWWQGPHRRFVLIAFAWSWIWWFGAWVIGMTLGTDDILHNQDLVWRVGFVGDVPGRLLFISLLALVGVYGPAVAARIVGGRPTRTGPVAAPWSSIALVLAIVTVPSLVISMMTMDRAAAGPSNTEVLPVFVAFLVVQFLTSATEEFGWRGYLTRRILPDLGFWDTGWSIGPVWAAWHYPVVVMIFAAQGLAPAAIIGSLAGFTMGIIAMAIFHAWVFERGGVWANVVVHAVFNAVPLTIVLLYPDSPAALLSNLLLWAVVFWLRRTARRSQPPARSPSSA